MLLLSGGRELCRLKNNVVRASTIAATSLNTFRVANREFLPTETYRSRWLEQKSLFSKSFRGGL